MLSFPRILGSLVLVWGLRAVVEAFVTGEVLWAGAAVLWLVGATYLLMGRLVPVAASLVLALIGVELVVRVPQLSGLELLAWLAAILVVTEGRPGDRTLLLRICVTVVYAFAALSKLNPSWLAGDGIVGLITRQSQLSAFQGLAESPGLASLFAVAVICLEGGLPFGLWYKRTRWFTAAVGVLMHGAFVVVASPNAWAFVHLVIFNFGLVACYPAFWADIHAQPRIAAVDATQPRTLRAKG